MGKNPAYGKCLPVASPLLIVALARTALNLASSCSRACLAALASLSALRALIAREKALLRSSSMTTSADDWVEKAEREASPTDERRPCRGGTVGVSEDQLSVPVRWSRARLLGRKPRSVESELERFGASELVSE